MFNTSKQSFDLLRLLFEVKTGEYFNDSTYVFIGFKFLFREQSYKKFIP